MIRIVTQFLAQTLGIIVLRTRRPDFPRPFRMWLYPFPALLAFAGYVYTVIMRPKSIESIRLALLVVIVGTVLFWIPSKANKSKFLSALPPHRRGILDLLLRRVEPCAVAMEQLA